MRFKCKKTFLLFWITGILILMLGIKYYDDDSTLDINVHDTYYVIQSSVVNIFFVCLMGLSGLLYWSYSKFKITLHKGLIQIHTIITILCTLFILLIPEILIYFPDGLYSEINILLFICFVLVVISQPILIINLLRGLIIKIKKLNKEPKV